MGLVYLDFFQEPAFFPNVNMGLMGKGEGGVPRLAVGTVCWNHNDASRNVF